jgi:hypothetical protein
MKKSVLGFTIAGMLVAGGYATTSLAANDENANPVPHAKNSLDMTGKAHGHHKGAFIGDPEKLIAKAKELGISTTGKDAETLFKEIRETIVKKEAKKLGIPTEGKDTRELAHEVMSAKVKADAKELNITIDGKMMHELIREVRKKKVENAAKELGISTKDKTMHEIMKAIKDKDPDKLKELRSDNPFLHFGKWAFRHHGQHEGHHEDGNDM